MRVRLTTTYDPAALAHSVRELASEAHLILNDPSAEMSQIRDLADKVADLQRHVGAHPHHELTRWLESARLRIGAA